MRASVEISGADHRNVNWNGMIAAARTLRVPACAGLKRSRLTASRTAAVNSSCVDVMISTDDCSTRPVVSTINLTTTLPSIPARRRRSGYRGGVGASRNCIWISAADHVRALDPSSLWLAGQATPHDERRDSASPKSIGVGGARTSTGEISDGIVSDTLSVGVTITPRAEGERTAAGDDDATAGGGLGRRR